MNEPLVTVKQGDLRGVKTESIVGGSYISFKGIPYATPPVGELRFRDPEPPKSWTGVRDAFTEGSKCAQLDMFTKTIIGDDDCLYLNVATTSLSGSRPVMVWIHPGAFVLGDGGFDMYSPDYLMGSEVVYVSVNFRLGILGFLHLDDEAAPGNVGLKDLVASLKWIQENISQFGGDPNNVTIFGGSSGGAAVHYLLISPLAKGLFHKAIIQSGVVLNPWASVSKTLDTARRYVAALGKDLTDPNEIVEYLRTVPVHKLIEVQENMPTLEERINLINPFGPGVDDKSIEPFMPKHHQEFVAKGFDVPVIIGYNSHEGILFMIGLQDEIYKKFDENFEAIVARDLGSEIPLEKIPIIAKELRNFYFGDERITKDSIDKYIKYCGDLLIVAGIHKVLEIQRVKKSPTYFYRFSYGSPNSLAKTLFQVNKEGAMHAEEFQYLFFASQFRDYIKMERGSTEEILRDRLVRMWTDFAKSGNPTPVTDDLITEKWEPVTKNVKHYLEINADLSLGQNPDENMWQLWKRIEDIINE